MNITADQDGGGRADGWTVSKIDSTVTFPFPETAVTGETYTVKVDYPRSADNRATQAVVNMTAVDKSQLAQPVISGLSLAVDPSDETSGTVTVSWNAVEGAAYYQLYAGGELKVETDSASAQLGIGAGYAGSLPTVEENASLTVKGVPGQGQRQRGIPRLRPQDPDDYPGRRWTTSSSPERSAAPPRTGRRASSSSPLRTRPATRPPRTASRWRRRSSRIPAAAASTI